MIDSELDFAAIHDFLRQKTVPHAFATLVKVQLVVARFTSLLNRDLDDAASSSLIRLLDTELNALKPDGLMDDDQSRSVELCILDAKMHFYTLFITKTPHGLSSREITLRTAFSHALRIIHISTSEWRARPEGRTDPVLIQKQRSLPKNHHRSFAFATIFLLRFFHRSGTASMEERQLAANHISLAGEHFKACSIEPLDEYSRTAKVFEVLARTTPSDVGSKMRLTHRMGVSILLDAVANAGEVRGKPVTLAEERPPDQGNQIDGTFQDMREMGYSADEVEVGLNVLGGLWEDPILSMLNFEPMSPMAE